MKFSSFKLWLLVIVMFISSNITFSQQETTIYPQNTGTVYQAYGTYGNYANIIRIGKGFGFSSSIFRGYAVFDISSIPSTAIITDITLYLYTEQPSGSWNYRLMVKQLTVNPILSSSETLYNDIGDGYTFIMMSNVNSIGWHSIPLSIAINDLQSLITASNNVWTIGFQEWEEDDIYIEIAPMGGANQPYCIVKYELPTLSISPDSRDVSYSAGETTFNISNTGLGLLNYSSSENAEWLTIQSGGSGSIPAGQSETMHILFLEYTGQNPRTATITITAPGALGSPKYVYVTQQPGTPILTVTPASRNIAYSTGTAFFNISNAGTAVLNYSSNDDADWLTIQSGGSGLLFPGQNTNMFISFTENSSQTFRLGTITLTAPGAQGSPKFLTVIQVPPPQFIEQTSISLPGVESSSAIWGDYDNDGDLDILLKGYSDTGPILKIYRNDGNNTFAEQSSITLTGVYGGSVDWGDYDNDGDLDILLTGWTNSGAISKIYRNNNNNTFTEQTSIVLPGVIGGSAAWGDYDNDGDLDFILAGDTGPERIAKIFRNNGDNSFTEQTSINLTGICYGSVNWGDYDNNGSLDILLTGRTVNWSTPNGTTISKIYKNNGDNTFSEQTSIFLTNLYVGSAAWGDYNNDGYLDILVTADTNDTKTLVFKNNGGNSFTEQTSISLIGVLGGSVAWGDYDNDGYLDILLTGLSRLGYYGPVSKVYHNNKNNSFTESTFITLPGVENGSAIWGDYDNDGDLDILLTGMTEDWSKISKIFKNYNLLPNSVPDIPGNLSATYLNEQDVTLSWDKSTDNETPQNGLSYNIVIGTNPNGINILSPMAEISNGYRRIVSTGNTGHNNSYTIKKLPEGEYYWSVQAIDNTYAGSSFSTWHSFITSTVTPEQMVQDIIDEIEELVNTSSLTQEQAQPLITKLEEVLSKIEESKITPAINQLNAFINQVNAYINSSILTQEEGQMLITSAQDLIAELTQLPKYSQELSNDNSQIPEEYKLEQNYPNPFNPVTNIKFQIVNPGLVTLKIYDILGNEVTIRLNEELEAGYYNFHWDANQLPSGVYFYQLRAGSFVQTKKMLLLK